MVIALSKKNKIKKESPSSLMSMIAGHKCNKAFQLKGEMFSINGEFLHSFQSSSVGARNTRVLCVAGADDTILLLLLHSSCPELQK